FFFFFFFSSRRRHTRWPRDWSSDVCSSDLDYSLYENRNNSPSHAVGVDLTRGKYIHSLRFGFLRYHNSLLDTAGPFGGTSAFGRSEERRVGREGRSWWGAEEPKRRKQSGGG